MSWDDVELDFGGEETANFGPRQETGTALFQVDTLATISPRGEVICNPVLNAACGAEGFCVSAGKQISLFDETCHDFSITISFDSDVDVIAWSEDSMFVVVAETSGVINFVDVGLKMKLFSQSLVTRNQNDQTKCFKQMMFIPGRKSGVCELLVLASNGSLFRFSNVNLDKLNQAIEARDFNLAKQIQGEIALEETDIGYLHTEGANFFTTAFWEGSTHIVTCGRGNSVAAVWKCGKNGTNLVRTLSNDLFGDAGVVQCRVSTNGKWLFLLDDEHTLSVFDPRTFILLDYWPDVSIQEFILMNYNSVNTGNKNRNAREPELQMVVLTPGPDFYLKVFTLPGMECTYSLAISKYCKLAEVLPSQEPIFLLEGTFEEYLTNTISTLRVRCLTEALPETRFKRLLNKKKFEEAEKFAIQFNLDVELVYRVKATDLLEKASPWTKYPSEDSQTLRDEMTECLDHITDITFVVEACTHATMPTQETMYDLLKYAKERLEKVDSTQDNDNKAELATKVLHVTHRLETFQMVYSSNAYSAEQWDIFLRSDMLEELLKWLTLGQLTEADVIWKRHKPEFETAITEEILQQLLNAIPESLQSEDITMWLQQDIIPFVNHRFSKGKKPLAQWMTEKAKNMETSEKMNWPQNSLKFAELFFAKNQDTRLSPEEYTVELTSKTTFTAGASELWELVQKLRALQHLRNKYKCKMSLAEYDRETISSIVFRMLDRVVAPELVPSTIEQVVRPYMKENNLSEDKLLLQYIEDLLEHTGKQSAYSYESSWEAKAIAVIRCMNDMECHITGIYTVMSFAAPPWSPVLENLIQSGLALKHPKVADLKERCEVLQLKKVLSKYGLTRHNVLDKTTAQTVMRYVILQDKPDSLKDALRVVKAYSHMSPADAYLFHIKFIIVRNRLEEILDLLKTLPKPEAKLYCKKIITWAQMTLESAVSSVNQEQCIEETGLITQGALTMLHFLLAGSDESMERMEREEWQALLVDLKNVLALQTEFGEFLSVNRFRDESVRKSLLTQYLIKFYTNQDITSKIERSTTLGSERRSRPSDSKKSFNKILRLGELLKFSTNEIQGQLAIKAAKTGEVETAMRIARELSSQIIDQAIAQILFTIVHAICKLWSEGNTKHMTAEYMADMQNMARKASASCRNELLYDCVELCKHLSIASQVYHQCESGDYGITVKTTISATTSKDPYNDWIMDDFFKEDTLVMESAMVLPMVYQFTMDCMPSYEGDQEGKHIGRRQFVETEPEVKEEDTEDNTTIPDLSASHSYVQDVSISAMSLIQHLQENNQYEIAMKVLLVGLGTCMQHFVANTCCLELCNKKQVDKEEQLIKDIGNVTVERLKMFTTTILMKICGSRRVDEKLGLAYTCIMPKQSALDKLKALVASAGQNYKKLLAVAIIGEAFTYLIGEMQVLESCRKLIISAKWGKRLSKLKISNMRDVFSSTSIQNKQHILPYLVKQPVVDVKLIKEYCSAFDILEVNEALLNHLDMLLLPDNHAEGPVEINKAAIENVLASITEPDLKAQKLSDTIDKVNPYDYERLIYIMQTITDVGGNKQNLHNVDLGLKILYNLMEYTRKTEPSQFELDSQCTTEEEQLRGITERLSPLAKTRLPYHPLIKGGQWKILTPELNEDTVETLMLICNLLRLPADHVYVVVINNIMGRYKDQASISRSMGDSSAKTAVIDLKALEKLQKLLLQIESADMAIATARVVAKALPLGPEKVMMLKACEMLARHAMDKRVADNCEEKKKAQILHQKLSAAYKAVATEQILRKHQLASPNLLALVETPARLIFTLYEHPSVQERKPGKQQDLPDIHAAVQEIATVNKVDILKIWNRLVEMWLPHPSANKQSEEDVTMNMNISLVTLDESSHNEEEKSLKRVIYVMQARDVKSSGQFLLNYAYKVESENITNACRVRALRCLFTLFDAEEIEKLTGTPIKEIREYMKNLLYLCKLAHLNISMDLPAFVNVDKEGLVRGLWRNHSRNQKAVRLVADLCIDYKIHDSPLWNSILIQLISFNMMDFLRHVLSSLSALPHLWQIQCLPRAWRSVLLAPFTAVCAPLTEDQEDLCRESAVFLQSCPMAMSLDLMSLCKQYMKVEMYAEALGCLLYIPEQEKKHAQIKSLLDCQCHVAILGEIAKVEKTGKQMPQMEKIQAAVFDHLAQSDSYSTLQDTQHLNTMVKYFVKTKNIRGLLRKALMAKKVNEAVDIVSLYTSMHPDTPSVHNTHMNPASGIHTLRTYLKVYKHEDLLQYVPKETRAYHSESTG